MGHPQRGEDTGGFAILSCKPTCLAPLRVGVHAAPQPPPSLQGFQRAKFSIPMCPVPLLGQGGTRRRLRPSARSSFPPRQ